MQQGLPVLHFDGFAKSFKALKRHKEDVKKELIAGNPIIVPVAGQLLGNLYFTPPGPEYHVLVIKGYNDGSSEFITNDPGTQRGADFRYNYQVLKSVVSDIDDKGVLSGIKAVIVIKK